MKSRTDRSGGAELDQDRRPTAIRAGQQVKKATDLGPTCLLIVPTSVVYNCEHRFFATWLRLDRPQGCESWTPSVNFALFLSPP